MRQYLIALISVGLGGAVVRADDKPRPIDVKPVIDNLDVYRDDMGLVLVTPNPLTFKGDVESWVFYGDGKTLYQQRVIGNSISGAEVEWAIWSPRVKGLQQAQVSSKANGVEVRCRAGKDGHQLLVPVPKLQAKALLAKATFLPPLWQRQAQFLARDEDGVYFYVDRLQDELGGKGYRVFMGKKGSMKALSMTNIVSDSAGEIYATKAGELKIVTGTDGRAFWKKGGKKSELVVLELFSNRYLIYRELGIYGTLGVVCDAQ
ncbi:hypothetical protein BH11MYX3_BH11MYX3_37170 [soil metagenome]